MLIRLCFFYVLFFLIYCRPVDKNGSQELFQSQTDEECSRIAQKNLGLFLSAESVPFVKDAKKEVELQIDSGILPYIKVEPDMDKYHEKPERINFNFFARYKEKEYPFCRFDVAAIKTSKGLKIKGRKLKKVDTSFLDLYYEENKESKLDQKPSEEHLLEWIELDIALGLLAKALDLDISTDKIDHILNDLDDEDLSNQVNKKNSKLKKRKRHYAEKCLAVDKDGKILPGWNIDFEYNNKDYWGSLAEQKVIKAEKKFFEADGLLQLFKEGSVGLKSGLNTVTIKDMSSGGSLCSPTLKVKLSEGQDIIKKDLNFKLDPTDHHFDEVSVFGNASITNKWFSQTAGKNIPGGQLILYLDQTNDGVNNSSVYLPGKKGEVSQIKIGNGDKKVLQNLRIDPDVIAHEYGHHVVYQTLSSTDGESVVVHEGLADFFVFIRSGNTCLGESICPKGSSICISDQCLRSGSTTMRYDAKNLPPEAHKKSQVLSGMLWDIHLAIPDLDMAHLVYQSLAYLDSESGLSEYLHALLTADEEAYDGIHACQIYDLALKRGFSAQLADIDCKSFTSK